MPRRAVPSLGPGGITGRLATLLDEHASGSRSVRPMVEYQTDPLGFVVDVLRIPRHTLVWSENPGYSRHEWDGTPDPLVRICDVLAGKVPGKRHAAVEAATGTQKTYTAAGLVLWFLACFEDGLVITTAPKEKQLKENLWKEIAAHLPTFKRRFPKTESIDLKIRMRPVVADPVTGDEVRQEKWSAVGWVAGVDAGAESAVRSQGFHAEHMLIVVEEAPGMDPAVLTALKNTATAPHNILLALGNPDNQTDPLHLFSELPAVESIRISAYDHPNVVCDNPQLVPGATSRGFIAEKRSEYGETGPLYLSRVRGLSPKEAHDALIAHDHLEAAALRWRSIMGKDEVGHPHPVDADLRRRFLERGAIALGCDPANTPNGDRFALSEWHGAVCWSVEKLRCEDAMEFGERIAERVERLTIPAAHVGVDGVGVGAATVSYLRRRLKDGGWLRVLQGGEEDPLEGAQRTDQITPEARTGYAADSNRFYNLRAQMAWGLRERLRRGTVAIPKIPELWRELTAIRYTTEGGVVKLEKKKDIAKRLGRSPDFADAVIYGDYVRPPLPMDEPEVVPASARDRHPGIDWKRGAPKRRESAADQLDRELRQVATVEWRRSQRVPRWPSRRF